MTDDERAAEERDGEPTPLTDPDTRFQVVEEAGGYSLEDAYRVLAGLPPGPVEVHPAPPADDPDGPGYRRDEAYRVLRGQPPREEDTPDDGA